MLLVGLLWDGRDYGLILVLTKFKDMKKILLFFISLLIFQIGNSQFVNMISGGVIDEVDMLLTSTGDGTGVSTLALIVSEDMTITLGANAKFYSDAGGTADESSSFIFLTGAERTRYIKCTTGTATMTFSDGRSVTGWEAWTSSTNAVSLGGDISELSNLINLKVLGSNIISGSIAGLTSLARLQVYGSNTLSGDVSALTSLIFLFVSGSNILSGDLNPIVSDITGYCYIAGNNQMVDYTSGATWGNAEILINPAAGYGYDEDEIDNMLIDMAASVALISKTITLQGSSAARTAASDAAVATLEGAGRNCTVVTN